jgi:hypothetical protein
MSPELQATEIGKAFIDMKRKIDSAWSYDENLAQYDDGPSGKQLKKAKELWNEAEVAQDIFIELLEKIVIG